MINKNKLFNKIEKDFKVYAKKELMYIYLNDYLRYVHLKKLNKPKGKENFVGIEIECYSDYDKTDILKYLIEYNLEKHVQIDDDGSIEPNFGQSYELKILSKEKELPIILNKLEKIFKKGKFGTNETCGLHVHLDMRNRNFEECYEKLIKFQDILFPIVKRDRWINEYCDWTDKKKSEFKRFSAINRLSYPKHKTIEIRLHHGTLDTKKIENWINLLIKCVNSKEVPIIKSKKDAIDWIDKDKKLKKYIEKNFKNTFFLKRNEIIKGFIEEENQW